MISRTNVWKHCPTCEGGIRRRCEWGCGRPCDHDDAPCPTCKKYFADMKKATKAERERCASLMEHYQSVTGLAGQFRDQDLFRDIASWIREGDKHVVITVEQILKNVKRLERSGRL